MNNKAVMLGLSVLAFLVAAVLVIMIFRMLFGGRLRMPGGRARQARLGIVDAFDLDRQRQLIIVRRDNTEHLIMIGGPNDVVIESEIVRAEVRDLRDQRRDTGMAPGTNDGRIPAPPPAQQQLQRSAEEPMLPMPMPSSPLSSVPMPSPPMPSPPMPPSFEPRLDIAPDQQQRGPTFPLPPRRPMPSPTPDRRPPAPPKLPDSVSRGDDVPAFSGQPPAPAPAPPVPMPPPALPPQAAPSVDAPPPVAAPPRPPFLKPLPPRPPLRPMPRTTPQAPSMSPSPAAPPQTGAAPPPAVPPRPNRPPQTPPPAESQDALESLEEEMAKLLGRGS